MAHKLYVHKICPYAQRAYLVAHAKGLFASGDIELVEVSLPTPDWYNEKVNPRETVPALQLPERDGKPGAVVPESLIVAQYIDERFAGKGPSFFPGDAKQRADVRLFVSEADNAIPGLYKSLIAAATPKKFDPLYASAKDDLGFLEKLFEAAAEGRDAASNGPFFLGKELSLADVALAPFLHRFKVTLGHFGKVTDFLGSTPRLAAMLAAVEALPAFQQTTLPPDEFIKGYASYVEPAEA